MVSRIVTGAHYGLRDWLAQRVTAVIMAVYTAIVLVVVIRNTPVKFELWRGLFEQGWMRVATLLFAVSLAWHAWVGMRDILMDYVKLTGWRLFMEICTLVLIAVYVAWTIQILWR
jgi:succinate dehydrogenase / fumarate reductase, membrane anchor subunit